MKITRIVVPTDFSADSEAPFQWALDLSVALGASIDLIHVVENPLAAGVWSSAMYTADVEGLHVNLVRDAERQLLGFIPKIAGVRCGVHRTVRTGDPAHEIVAFAAERGAHLIVMGTRGKTGLSHVLMGSVAEQVSRTAPCPVLTVKSSQEYAKLLRAPRGTARKIPA